jgi:hypothetical protein
MLTPVDATAAGLRASKPAASSATRQVSPASGSTGTKRSCGGTPWPGSSRRRRFHACMRGWSTSNTASRDARSGRRCTQLSSPAPSSTYWSTPAATASATRSSM